MCCVKINIQKIRVFSRVDKEESGEVAMSPVLSHFRGTYRRKKKRPCYLIKEQAWAGEGEPIYPRKINREVEDGVWSDIDVAHFYQNR